MYKVPPTFLQAMHQAAAEVGQALKSPEKAGLALEGDELSCLDLGKGVWLLQVGKNGEQAEAGHGHLTNTTLHWGVPGQAKEATTSEHPPSAPPLPPPGLFGARHSGPKGFRVCICLKINKV